MGGVPGRIHPVGTDDVEHLVALRREHPDLVVVVDDAERSSGLGPVLQEVTRLADDDEGFVVAATTPAVLERRESALVEDLARAETGVVLHPRPGARVLGVTLTPNVTVTPGGSPRIPPPGRGLLVLGRRVEAVQVALPDGPAHAPPHPDAAPDVRRS